MNQLQPEEGYHKGCRQWRELGYNVGLWDMGGGGAIQTPTQPQTPQWYGQPGWVG